MLSKTVSRRELLKMSGAAVAAVLLAACQPQVVEKVVEKEVTKIVEVEKKLDVITLSFITPGGLGLERLMYSNFLYKFTEENPAIKVNVSFEGWSDYMIKLPTILAGGVVPDVIHTHRSIHQEYAWRGVLIDLNPYMQRDNVDPEDFVDVLIGQFRHRGKQTGLPKDSGADNIYYNKTMMDAAGLDYPKDDWSFEDFREYALKLTRDENGYPASDPKFDPSTIKQWGYRWSDPTVGSGSNHTFSMVNAMGTNWYNEDFTECFVDHPGAIELVELLRDMRCVDHSIPTPGEALGQGDQFRAGLCAMATGHHSTTFYLKAEKVKFDYDVVFCPSGPGGQYVSTGASGWCIPTEAEYKEEAWELVKFLVSFEVQKFITSQKRWGACLKAAIEFVEPDDGYPEHFAMCHTDPFKEGAEHKATPMGGNIPPLFSKIKQISKTEFDAIHTCAGGDVAEAASRAKKQIDEVLAETLP